MEIIFVHVSTNYQKCQAKFYPENDEEILQAILKERKKTMRLLVSRVLL